MDHCSVLWAPVLLVEVLQYSEQNNYSSNDYKTCLLGECRVNLEGRLPHSYSRGLSSFVGVRYVQVAVIFTVKLLWGNVTGLLR